MSTKRDPKVIELWCPLKKPRDFALVLPGAPGAKPVRGVFRIKRAKLKLGEGRVELKPKGGFRRFKPNGVVTVELTVVCRRLKVKVAHP